MNPGGLAARAAASVARRLPRGFAAQLGRALGWGWYRLLPIRRGVARQNVARALPELNAAQREAVVAGMYRHLGLTFVELLRFGRAQRLREGLRVEGLEHLRAACEAGRGVLVLSAHLGNWELLVRAGALAERPLWVVTKQLSSSLAQAAWRVLRRGGPGLLPAKGSARAIVAALGRGEIVGYVLDQHMPPGLAIRAPFFGIDAATSPDLARLAALTGAPVLPVFTWREAEGHCLSIGAPLEVERGADPAIATVQFNEVIEAAVRAHPEQWLWIHRRWK